MAIGNIVRSQVPAALGLGRADGALEKLSINPERGDVIVALFNPNEISISKNVTWESETVASGRFEHLVFKSSSPATMTLNLFFDTYEGDPRAGGGLVAAAVKAAKETVGLGYPFAAYPLAKPSGTSVVKYTEQVAQLTRMNRELHRPPICKLFWGRFQLFRGVLTNLEQKFTLFLSDGTPVRATLTCTFTRYRSGEEAIREIDFHSADVPKTRTVRRGDTLSSIAAEEYGDPNQWRHIAKANGIHNPRALTPGQVLRVPKLKP